MRNIANAKATVGANKSQAKSFILFKWPCALQPTSCSELMVSVRNLHILVAILEGGVWARREGSSGTVFLLSKNFFLNLSPRVVAMIWWKFNF